MIMIVPTLATIVVGTNGLIGQVDTASSADRARVLANLSDVAGELVHRLQDERAAAVLLLGAGPELAEDRSAAYRDAQPAVDDAERQFRRESDTLADVPASFRELLGDVRGQLSLLPQTRGQAAAGEIGLTDAAASYGELAASLINLRDSSAQLVGDTALGDRMRAAAAISRAKEFLSQQRVIGHEVLIRGAYQPSLRSAFIAAKAGYENFLQIFAAAASGPEQALLDQALEGSDVRQSQLYQDYLESLEGEELGTPPWDAASWDTVMSTHADLVRDLEIELDRVIVVDATALRNAVTQQVLVEAGALLAVVLLAFLLAWLVARSMARSLRDLRQGALAVAQHGLPQAVARLRDPALSTQLSPAQVAGQIAEPLPVRSRDEFGQVAEAFNAVHLEAVRTAAEQAQLRSSVATMFVNLARRSQILVDRLISHLDRLERGEEDPDRLAELFQLDHLATRMRRNDENLLVLAGADSTRVQRDPASLIDVLRAAQSEVEHYTRIEFGVVDRDLEVAAHAVNDLVHLVAELLDNATVFSPPDSPVLVEARRVGDRAVLYVEDRGLGLSPQQLAEINDRLATPPMVDVAVSRMMGLVVVARLAARHGVAVELRPAVERGTVADVTLPASVLVPRALGSRPAEPPPPVRLEPMRPGPPAERLALESGRSGAGRFADSRSRGRSHPPFDPPAFAQPPAFAPPVPPAVPAGDPARAPGRSMPAWSDLTGATGSNGPTGPNGADSALASPTAAPLPRRRPGAGMSGEPEAPPAGSLPIPTPRAGSPGELPPAIPPPAPPPWPPVAPATATPVPAETGAVTDPEATVPARPVPATASGRRPAAAGGTGPAGGIRTAGGIHTASGIRTAGVTGPAPTAEETMELPIFRELESAWFRTGRSVRPPGVPGGGGAEAGGAQAAEFATVSARSKAARGRPDAPAGTTAGDAAAGEATSGESAPEGAGAGTVPTEGWQTAADDGWRAASSAAEAVVQETTATGLPKRRPMAQLVPGGVEREQASAQHRSPDAVRGLLSAYHRGVQRGREQTTDQDGDPSNGSPSTPAGKERRT
jgi:signal transduction histidine kinase